MNYFITSDTHFNHTNIIKYCNRPFKSVEEMDQTLINNWNNVVSKEDTVFHLGDFAFIKKFNKLKELRNLLNGKIILILGNHDTKYFKPFEFLDAGIDEVYPIYECILFNNYWVFSHYQMTSWNRSCHGSFHCFGHEHWNEQYKFDHEIFKKFHWSELKFNVCADANNFTPINLLNITKFLANKKEQIKNENNELS